MRTTIDLPDELARAAKIRAAERGETLKDMLARAVARELAMGSPSGRTRVTLPLVGEEGAPPMELTSEDLEAAIAADDERYAG